MLLKCFSILVGVFVYLEYVQADDFKATAAQTNTSLVNHTYQITQSNAIEECRKIIERSKNLYGVPGMTVAVSIDGETIWKEGFGYSDLENLVPCTEDTVMRIGSISKPITVTAAAKLWEDGQLDMDKSILEYLPDYPQPKFNGTNVTITPRQLATCTSGIRDFYKVKSDGTEETLLQEFYNLKHYKTIKESLEVFNKEQLRYKPGEKYYYSSYGFSVLSAVIEAVANQTFVEHMTKHFEKLGLDNTYIDEYERIIYNRAKFYTKKESGPIIHSNFADSSAYLAGGGYLSTSGDLVKFGNNVLYSSQASDERKAFLKADTVSKLWKPTEQSLSSEHKSLSNGSGYGMGFFIRPRKQESALGKLQKFIVNHAGGVSGSTSVLFIQPKDGVQRVDSDMPKGIVVALLANSDQAPPLHELADEIINVFEKI